MVMRLCDPRGVRPAIRISPVPAVEPPFDDEPFAWSDADQLTLPWRTPAATSTPAWPGGPMPPGGVAWPDGSVPPGGSTSSGGSAWPVGSPPPGGVAALPGGVASPGGVAPLGGPAWPDGSVPRGGVTSPGRSAWPGGPVPPGGPASSGGSASPGGSALPGGFGSPAADSLSGLATLAGLAGPGRTPPPIPPEALAGASAEARGAAHRFLTRSLEILNGYRPIGHLRAVSALMEAPTILTSAGQALRAIGRYREAAGLPPVAGRRPLAPAGRVHPRRLRVCEPRPGVAEASAVLTTAGRTWALAYRLELLHGRWLATAFTAI